MSEMRLLYPHSPSPFSFPRKSVKIAKSKFCFAKVGHVVKVYQDKPVNKKPIHMSNLLFELHI